MNPLQLPHVSRIEGRMNLPGSKSLSNRALLLAALSPNETQLDNLLRSEDTQAMVTALNHLGVSISLSHDWQTCTVRGNGGLFQAPNDTHFLLGNAGTAIRPLTSILALMQGEFILDGDQYMRQRPINHLVDALRQLGARISYLGAKNCPPIKITGGRIRGGDIKIQGDISSQYLTSLLLALPLAPDDSRIHVIGEQVSKPYLDLTLDIMQKFGVRASHDNYQTFDIPGNQAYRSPGRYLIEGDASSASYFYAAAAIKGGTLRIDGLGQGSVQGDIAFLDVIEAMGAGINRSSDWIEVTKGDLVGIDMDLNHIPDAAMTVATMAVFAKGPTRIRNVYNWRVKETDRMLAMSTELRKLGAKIETGEDYIIIDPPETIQSASIDTYGDHRIAMAFSLASLSDAQITINDPECTAKTFPGYFDVFASICKQ